MWTMQPFLVQQCVPLLYLVRVAIVFDPVDAGADDSQKHVFVHITVFVVLCFQIGVQIVGLTCRT